MSRLYSILPRISLSSLHCCIRPISAPRLTRTFTMTHPAHSSSQPAQLPALTSAHAANTFVEDAKKQTKEKKNPKVVATSSGYPLEVRITGWKLSIDELKLYSCNLPLSSLITAWKSSTSSRLSTILGFHVCLCCFDSTVVLISVLKRNQEKRSPLLCLMAQNGRAEVGKLVRWISPKRCQRVCQSVWWLPRYETLDPHDLTSSRLN